MKIKMLNLGCGGRYHTDWINIDLYSQNKNIISHNLNKGIPFESESYDVIYSSHLIEHLSKKGALNLLKECFRVLKEGGIIRIVVPDLEQITKIYLSLLEKSLEGDKESQKKYEWIVLELFDQMVRNYSGGEMLEYGKQNPMPVEEFVLSRCGSEVTNFIKSYKGNNNPDLIKREDLSANDIGKFRLAGEIHQWMYDKYSLRILLKKAGFKDFKVMDVDKSQIKNFNSYRLDIDSDGLIRKPDSLFMEAKK